MKLSEIITIILSRRKTFIRRDYVKLNLDLKFDNCVNLIKILSIQIPGVCKTVR